MTMSTSPGPIGSGFSAYGERRIIGVFMLGITSGFPLTLVISLTAFWLSFYGVSKEAVGLFALATLPYAWKFLWSPAIDSLSLGVFGRLLGQRRAWLILIQAGMALAIVGLSALNPRDHLEAIAALVALIGFLSASQDIVLDAYRIEILDENQMGHGASMVSFGYRAGNLIAGYGVLRLADVAGWPLALLSLTLLLLPGLLTVFWLGEPGRSKDQTADRQEGEQEETHPQQASESAFYTSVVEPFREFISRPNWLLILLFVFAFKAGDALAAVMTAPLLVDLQFTETEIANANKLVGTVMLWLGIALGAVLYRVMGTFGALMLSGFLMMMTNLMFAWLATVGHSVIALAVTIGAENFASGLGSTVVIAYLSSLCNIQYTATQYALLSSLASQARALLASSSGFMAESLGWVQFFVLATVIALPGMLLLVLLWRRTEGQSERQTDGQAEAGENTATNATD